MIAFGLIVLFHLIYPRPICWWTFNILFPLFVMWEYGGIQRRMLNKIGLGYQQKVDVRLRDWRFLTNQLLNRICSRMESCIMLYIYHVVIITMPPIKMMMVLGILLVFLMGHKLSILDHFIREHKQFAFEYKLDPVSTKKKYEEFQEKNSKR